jgi:hypothetical protein
MNLYSLIWKRGKRLEKFAKDNKFASMNLERLFGDYGINGDHCGFLKTLESINEARQYNKETDELLLAKYLLF